MKLEGVIVCVNYSDFLSHSILFNKPVFDRLVVVTSPKDKETQKLCEFHHVMCVITDKFYENGSKFNKGKGINEGFKQLEMTDWVVHMDADIVLPPKTRIILESIALDKNFIYGIDRMMCPSFESWLKFLRHPVLQHETEVYIHAKAFPLGTRIMYPTEGYIPLGFFQMFNCNGKTITYPEEHTDAGRSDLLFAMRWPRDRRAMLPELIGIHLESMSGMMGANWNGRTTPDFSLEGIRKKKKFNLKEHHDEYPNGRDTSIGDIKESGTI
jgi:hypothetical protein